MVKRLLVYIHGENPRTIDYFVVHFLPFLVAFLYKSFNMVAFSNQSTIQLFFYYLFVWELLGGIMANLSYSTKLFWQDQELKTKLIYLFIHAIHPIIWFLIFKVDIRFGIFYFVYMSLSTIVLLKVSDKILTFLSILFTFGGILISLKIESDFNPFPFGLEWIPIAYFVKLIFAFTIKYKKKNVIENL